MGPFRVRTSKNSWDKAHGLAGNPVLVVYLPLARSEHNYVHCALRNSPTGGGVGAQLLLNDGWALARPLEKSRCWRISLRHLLVGHALYSE